MERTRRRPIAAGAVSPRRALAVSLSAMAAGVLGLLLVAGTPAAVFALCGAVYYVVVYTLLLKPRTPLSALPGGIAGIFPALIGWTAAGGGWSPEIVFVCALIVVWSPPHFWALSLALKDEYASSGIPTPSVAYGEKTTCRQILLLVAVLTALTAAPLAWGLSGLVYPTRRADRRRRSLGAGHPPLPAPHGARGLGLLQVLGTLPGGDPGRAGRRPAALKGAPGRAAPRRPAPARPSAPDERSPTRGRQPPGRCSR